MEQQLQETAGELKEAERALNARESTEVASHKRRMSLLKSVVADTAEYGPESPAVLRPGSAPLAPLSKDGEQGSVMMPGGVLMTYDSIRRDFAAVMQVRELAETHPLVVST